MGHRLEMSFDFEGDYFDCLIVEPESGEQLTLRDIPVDNMETFLKNVGTEIKSWVQLWADEENENAL